MKKILQNLKENWITYGFETLVVIVGILGAFALNNWNEKRQTTALEIEYLIRLHTDLANDTSYYRRRIAYAESVFEAHKEAIRLSFTQIESAEQMTETFAKLEMSSEALSVRDITFQEIVNAGNISILQNEELKVKLQEFYRQIAIAIKHFEEINSTSIMYLVEFDKKSRAGKYWSRNRATGPWTPAMLDTMDDWEWINDPQSENFQLFQVLIGFYTTKQEIFRDYCIDLNIKTTQLLTIIEQDLKSRSITIPEPKIEEVFVKE